MSPARLANLLLLCIPAAFIAPASFAQLPVVNSTTATPIPGAGHDYLGGLAETVNPGNGSVSIRIPVIVPPGRGLTLPFSFAYDSSGVNFVRLPQSGIGHFEWFTTGADAGVSGLSFSQTGWSNSIPMLSDNLISWTTTDDSGQRKIQCYAVVNFVYQDPSGNRHNLGLTNYSDPGRTGACTTNYQNWPIGFDAAIYTLGGEGPLQATLPATWSGAYEGQVGITDGDGVSYSSSGGTQNRQWPVGFVGDRNGNYLTINTASYPAFNYVDTVGRTVLQDSGFAVTPETVTVSGLGAPYSLNWTTLSTPTFTAGTTVISGTTCTSLAHNPWDTYNDHAVSSVTLPNGKGFSFTYDPVYGLINKMTYPTGGYVRYVWGLSSRAAEAHNETFNGQSYLDCDMSYDVPAVVDRYVSFDGTTEVQHQHFVYYTNWPAGSLIWSYKTTTVTTYDLVHNTSFQTVYTYSYFQDPLQPNAQNGLAPQIPVESSIAYYDTNGALLKTIYKGWANERILASQQTSYPSGQPSSLTVYCYNSSELETEHDDYDFGSATPTLPACAFGVASGATSGPVLRKTLTTYATNTNMGIYHVIDKPASVVVTDGSNNKAAETDYTYDSPLGTLTSGIVGHSPACNCGNLTVQSQWVNSSGATLSTNFTNDDTGQRLTMTDPNGNLTKYSYTDSYSSGTPPGPTNAYLTTLTLPPTPNAAHIEKFVYAYASAEVTSSTDQNNLVTSYKYVDNLARLTETDLPDGGVTAIAYNDAAYNPSTPSPSVTTTKKINSATSLLSISAMDGLGHPVRSEITSDPQGTIYADTAYDGLGRVYTVSNPYRSGSDPTTSSGTTTYIYDALGRKCVEIPQDGTAVSGNACPTSAPAKDLFTQYSGPTTTVTDQTGKKRQSTTDGLGRLIQVVEDPGGLGYITNYTVNTLGNLTQIVQNGSHTRTFTYDFISRLLTSNNPEVGTIAYNYDSDSNCASPNSFAGLLVSKVDARGIRTCAQYDALNRQTLLNYSNGDPTVTTTYDQSNCLGLTACQNIGHATSTTDAAGSDSWAYQVNPALPGSAHANQRTTNNVTKTTTYVLDLAGNTTKVTYPTGRIVNFTFDAANRPATAADSANGITYAAAQSTPPTGCLTTGVCYTPQGSEYSTAIGKTGAFNGVNISETYNTRLQPLEIKAYSTAGSAIDITYSFVDPTSGGNSGNVNSITNNLNSSRGQSFAYDHLNRIVTAGTTATSGTYCWGYQYNYDAWANLLAQAGWSPNYNGCSEATMGSVTADGNNHISGFTYDASGNTQNDGTIAYTYDAESQIKTAAGVTYLYDGSGRRVSKSNGKLYWYDAGSEILAETDASGNTLNEYVYFGGKRAAMLPANGNAQFYAEDFLGTSRVMTQNNGTVCYDADLDPYGGEHPYTNNCPSTNNYKFEGKERDTETGNDDFGARYYTSRFGRWLSADWSSVPVAVPYANLTNPQTLNLYSMVSDDPEFFADLDGHQEADPEIDAKENPAEAKDTEEFNSRMSDALRDSIKPPPAPSPDFVNQMRTEGYDDPITGQCYAPDPNAGRPTVSARPGTLGKPDHQQTVKEEAEKMGGEREVTVKTPGGEKGSRRIDAAKRDKDGNITEATQVIRPNKNGTPPAREVKAANDIEGATGVKPKMVPVRPSNPNTTPDTPNPE